MPASRLKSSERTAYSQQKARARERSARLTRAGQDIAPMPPPRDPARRGQADRSFRFFCEAYFPHLFTLAWSPDHLRVIDKIERVVRDHETLAVAMPRGSGKTTLCMTAVQWAILSGQHKFVFLIASTNESALILLANIKSHLASNEGLLEDYPEAVYPIRCLEGETRRCVGQRFYGIPTQIGWGVDELIMPSIPGSRSAGAIIRVAGITGNIRGALHTRTDGTQVRPSLAVCDDPQTDQSARSILQTSERLSLVNGAISALAGPGERTAIIIPCTVIQHSDMADQLLDRNRNPSWHGERTKLMNRFPDGEVAKNLWGEYARIRSESLRADGDGHEATDFYGANRQQMDTGAEAAWLDRYLRDHGEISAVQHAMNLKLDRGDASFYAEYQNEPNVEAFSNDLTADGIAEKINGRPRGQVPMRTTHLTAYIDCHDKLLYWAVAAWEDDFTGYLLDYGTLPDQKRPFFTMRDARGSLARQFPGHGRTGAIHAGLMELATDLLTREWKRDDGGIRQVERLLIDAGYSPETVFGAVRKIGRFSTVYPARGVGIGPDNKPFSEYRRQPGEQYGHHWRIPSIRRTRELATVNIDTNFWKSFLVDRLATPQGDRSCLSLFGADSADHRLLAQHVMAEYRTPTQGRGRTVDMWKVRPEKFDNHWLDCLVGNLAAASMVGVALPGQDDGGRPAGPAEAVRLSDMQGRNQ